MRDDVRRQDGRLEPVPIASAALVYAISDNGTILVAANFKDRPALLVNQFGKVLARLVAQTVYGSREDSCDLVVRVEVVVDEDEAKGGELKAVLKLLPGLLLLGAHVEHVETRLG